MFMLTHLSNCIYAYVYAYVYANVPMSIFMLIPPFSALDVSSSVCLALSIFLILCIFFWK